jgi:DNA-binding HxlR family transcriptional regulator
MAKSNPNQSCPIAGALEIVGSRWTFLIIRDLLIDTRRFQDLQESMPGIAPNTLSSRLKSLEAHGLISRQFYSEHPPRAAYALTDQGRELGVVVLALAQWGVQHVGGGLNKRLKHDECFKLLKQAADALKRQPVEKVQRTKAA